MLFECRSVQIPVMVLQISNAEIIATCSPTNVRTVLVNLVFLFQLCVHWSLSVVGSFQQASITTILELVRGRFGDVYHRRCETERYLYLS